MNLRRHGFPAELFTQPGLAR